MAFVLKKKPKQFLFHAVVNSLFCCYAQGIYNCMHDFVMCFVNNIYMLYECIYILVVLYSKSKQQAWMTCSAFI